MPEIHYAKSGDVHIAYQVLGDGFAHLVYFPGFITNLELYWEQPDIARFLRHLATRTRVILFDKRGTGLSDRLVQMPNLDERMDDARAVMDAAGVDRAAVMGVSEGGSLAALFAATHPNRCSALILMGAYAHFSDWFPTSQKFEAFLHYADTSWGSGASFISFAPSKKGDMEFQRWWGRWERQGASPSALKSLMRMNYEINIAGILPSIHVPTLVLHRTEDPAVSVDAGRYLAAHIPGARLVELDGPDHFAWLGNNAMQIADMILDFAAEPGAAAQIATGSRRMLTTILFTDIVGSTDHARELGDETWRDVVDAHDRSVRREIARFQGVVVKTLGDGFLATFDGPTRAVRCASAVIEAVEPLGIRVRAGIHTGEVEQSASDIQGIAVHLAERILEEAAPGEVIVSRTVKDLIAGSGIEADDTGEHSLRGIEQKWQLFRVREVA